ADECEKYVGRRGADSGDAEGSKARPVMSPIRSVNIVGPENEHEEHNRNLDGNDACVEFGALFDAHDKNNCDNQGNDECGKIEADFHAEDLRSVEQFVSAR